MFGTALIVKFPSYLFSFFRLFFVEDGSVDAAFPVLQTAINDCNHSHHQSLGGVSLCLPYLTDKRLLKTIKNYQNYGHVKDYG